MNREMLSLSSSFAVVVNDDSTQLNVLSGLVRKVGLEPRAFTNAETALSEMSAWSQTADKDLRTLPALIVTDLYMPGIDGWRFCRLLRSPEYSAFNQIPILVVSATFAGGEADRIAADLGAEAFLPSPVDGKQFFELVRAILDGKRVRTPLRMLIVEDSQSLSDYLNNVFSTHGYLVDTAGTVQVATDAFRKSAYDVALLDYHLPDGLGDTLLDALRTQWPDCVCLMMTTDTEPRLALDWMKRGAAAYLKKPFHVDYLLELCERARRERALLRVQDLLEVRTRELRESEEKYRILLEESPDPIFSFTEEGRYTYVNRAFEKGVRKPVADIIGKRIWDIFPKEEADKSFASLSQVFLTGEQKAIEVHVPHSDVDLYYMTTITPIKDTAGKVISAICSSKDITERKLAEEERSLNLQRMQALLQLNHMTKASLQEITDFALEEAVRLTQSTIGYLAFLSDDESVLTMHSWSKSAMAECAIADKPVMYPVETTGLWGDAVRQRKPVITNDYNAGPLRKGCPEGHVVINRHMNTPVFAGSRIVLVAGVGNKAKAYNQDDVQQLTLLMEGMWRLIEHKRVEEALRESEKKYRLIADNTADTIWIIDLNMRFTYVSPSVKRMYGTTVEEVVDRTIDKSMTPESFQAVTDAFMEEMALEAGGKADPRRIRVMELEEYTKDRSTIWVESSMSFLRDENQKPVGIVGVSRDITDRKQAEEQKAKTETQLLQAQKFEAIGTLAGGIAHDFNNLLMGIQGRASLLSLDMEACHPHWEHIKAIEEYTRSATHLTKQLLGFAHGGKYEVKPIDIGELVLDSSTMFGRTKKEIRIHTKFEKSPLVVEADKGQIEQVLLNLYVNAWQAMPPEGGELYLEVKTVTLDMAFCKPHQTEPGPYVKVSVTDTGAGMDEATRMQIFDPFFTTKEKGRGTGLGLASVYGIIKNHGGMITVYSEIGNGSTFNIYLPLSEKPTHREIPVVGGLIKGSATILLVDDEEMVIDVGQAMLEHLGYRVVVCGGGQEAVKVITDMGNEIDLVILDLVMPGMNGSKTFDHIRKIQPEMPVLLSSGYAINGQAQEILRRGCNGFIQKPYNISVLSQKISKIMDESKGTMQQ
jgi:PAS domain S-box-containing protein